MRFGFCLLTLAVFWLFPLTARAQFASSYEISLDPQISSWTSDFSSRTAAIEANWTPTPSSPGDWTNVDSSNYPYGPVLPQLYTSSSSANPALTQDLRNLDRGNAVFNVGINSAPNGVSALTFSQQRLLEAANQLIGTAYQHTHLPQFDPNQSITNGDFTWKTVSSNTTITTTQELNGSVPPNTTNPNPPTVANPYVTTYGQPAPGIDCTDFAAYIYNEAVGIQMHSGTGSQVGFTNGSAPSPTNLPTATILSNTGAVINPTFILGPNYGLNGPNNGTTDLARMNQIISQLQPGDLLYMHDYTGIVHVVIWLGAYGTNADGSPSTIPLVISSHDNTPAIFATPDSNIDPTTGLPIMDTVTGQPFDVNNPSDVSDMMPPPGVEILPFEPDNWFYQNFSFAMQILPAAVPEPSQYGFLVFLALACGTAGRRFFPGTKPVPGEA